MGVELRRGVAVHRSRGVVLENSLRLIIGPSSFSRSIVTDPTRAASRWHFPRFRPKAQLRFAIRCRRDEHPTGGQITCHLETTRSQNWSEFRVACP